MAALNLLSNTSTVAKVLISSQVASANTETTLYTVPTSSAATIKSGAICNTSGSAVTVNLSVVPSGGTSGVVNRVIASYSLAAFDTLDLRGYLTGATLGEGDAVAISVGTSAVIDVVITGLVSS